MQVIVYFKSERSTTHTTPNGQKADEMRRWMMKKQSFSRHTPSSLFLGWHLYHILVQHHVVKVDVQ